MNTDLILNIALGVICVAAGFDNIRHALLATRGWLQTPPGEAPRHVMRLATFWMLSGLGVLVAACRLFGWL